MSDRAEVLLAWVLLLSGACVLGCAGINHARRPALLAHSLLQMSAIRQKLPLPLVTHIVRAWGCLEALVAAVLLLSSVWALPMIARPSGLIGGFLLAGYSLWLLVLRTTMPGATCGCTDHPQTVNAVVVLRAVVMSLMFFIGALVLPPAAPQWLGLPQTPLVAGIAVLSAASLAQLLWILPSATANPLTASVPHSTEDGSR